jgi:ATP-dependent Lon protease
VSITDANIISLPVLPLPGGVVFPGMVVTVSLDSPTARAAGDAAAKAGNQLLLVPQVGDRYASVGVVASVETQGELPNGQRALVLRAIERAVIGQGSPDPEGTGALWLDARPVRAATMADAITDEVVELKRAYRAAVGVLLERQGMGRMASALRDITDPGALADTIHEWPELSVDRKVELLEELDPASRLTLALSWVHEAIAEADVKDSIREGVNKGIESQQREFLLRQQMQAIRKELGDDDTGSAAVDYRAKIEATTLPPEARQAALREADRLERVGEQGVEQSWIRTWLDTVLELPWGTRSADRHDLDAAQAILDADTTGLSEAKDRILEWLAVRSLRDQASNADASSAVDEGMTGRSPRRGHGTIILLAGPPGVGKTSLGESVARALNRSFVRIALGGVRDEAEIRGHRRTYVGAQPGRIVKALKDAKTMNPVILLDEIDKLAQGWAGDPSAAMLEVLDPAQNHTFRDHYLDVDLDLSDVVFLATANSLETLSAPLLDRMEIVTVDGYTDREKVGIARNHLLTRQLREAGMSEGNITISDDALLEIVEGYTREPGVRSLEREIRKVIRKVAVQHLRDAKRDNTAPSALLEPETSAGSHTTITQAEIPTYLGRRRRFNEETTARTSKTGVATGLAVTGAGGDVLFVEALAVPQSPGGAALQVTGQLGDVMKESASIALSFVRAHADEFGIDLSILDSRQVHVHFPAGAIPKDGPSAGITMTTALVSLLTGRKVRSDVAMTGEVTLQGNVLPIGGVKQKVLAAHRAGIKTVILPKPNEVDVDDIPEEIRSDLDIRFLDDVRDVITIALHAS